MRLKADTITDKKHLRRDSNFEKKLFKSQRKQIK